MMIVIFMMKLMIMTTTAVVTITKHLMWAFQFLSAAVAAAKAIVEDPLQLEEEVVMGPLALSVVEETELAAAVEVPTDVPNAVPT